VGAQARNIIFRGWRRLFDCLPGSQASTWLEPGTISHGATILFCFAWLLSFPMWGDVDGPACRPRQTMNYSWQARVYSPLTGVIMSHHIVHVGAAIDCLSGGVQSPRTSYLPWCWPPGSLVDQIFYGEASLYQGNLIRCQSDHVDCACSRGVVTKSGGD
jgi:hypothetical protein